MKLVASVEGREFSVEISADRRTVSLDGEPLAADITRVEPGVYSVLRGGRSFEILVKEGVDGVLDVYLDGRHFAVRATDPRRLRRRHGAVEAEGRQSVVAPMPGKVIRLLAEAGQSVEANQGLVVVEAMKMQNEIRSPKAGKVVEMRVTPGQAVNSGQVLLVVE
jgi:biotin carboxyl carrier protein